MMFKNCMEDFVVRKLDSVVFEHPMRCDCDICRLDVMLLALNSLKPRYVATDRGDLFTRLNMYEVESDIEVTCAVLRAIQVVGDKPRHE